MSIRRSARPQNRAANIVQTNEEKEFSRIFVQPQRRIAEEKMYCGVMPEPFFC